ncbi:MAG: hypothetical protein ACPLSY_03480 [Moorellaceae bacterium]
MAEAAIQQKKGIPTDKEFFAMFRLGNWVRISWPDRLIRHSPKCCYGEVGEIVFVGHKFIAVRGLTGFVFCVSRADIIEGTVVRDTVTKKVCRWDRDAGEQLAKAVGE